jgi:F-type H+-transporting ATPase subunit gamma
MPSSVEGIVGTVQELLVELDEWQAQGVERIVMFHQRPAEEHTHEPAVTQLIPLDREWLRSLTRRSWPTRQVPASYLEPRTLLTALTRELVFASLYRAHAESLASEHAARLDAMRSAEQTIEDRLDELQQRYHQVRQAAITEELLDVTSGFEALAGAED